jgi:hypothetical protein
MACHGETTYNNKTQALLDPSQSQVTEVSILLVVSSILHVIRCGILSVTFDQQILDHIDPQHASCSTTQRLQVDYRKFRWQIELLYYNGLLYVPHGSALLKVLEHFHNNYLVGYFGIHKTLTLITRSFW